MGRSWVMTKAPSCSLHPLERGELGRNLRSSLWGPKAVTHVGLLCLYPSCLVYLQLLSDLYYTCGDFFEVVVASHNLSLETQFTLCTSPFLFIKPQVPFCRRKGSKTISVLFSNLNLPWFQKRCRKLFTEKGDSGRCNLPTSHFCIFIHSF